MRLRNIPGAQDAILESPYVVQEPQTKKGHWAEVFCEKAAASNRSRNGKRMLSDGPGASSSGDQLCGNRDV